MNAKPISLPTVTVAASVPANGAWVRFSLPVPQGRLPVDAPLALKSADGAAVSLQTRPLACRADGSPRWLDCQALVPGGGDYQLVEGEAPLPANSVCVRECEGGIELDNGLVAVTLATSGPSPIAAIRAWGRTVSVPETPFEAWLESAGSSGIYTSACDDARGLTLRQRGPVRAVAEVTGRHGSAAGGSALGYRLQVIVTAGQAAIGLRYAFRHEDPGFLQHTVRQIALRMRWQTPAGDVRHQVHQSRYGLTSVSRDIVTASPVEIRAGVDPPRIHVHNLDCLGDPQDYPAYMNPPLNDTQPFTGLETVGGWVTAWVEDFRELCPTGLTAEADTLRLDIWPPWAGDLQVPQGRSREVALHLLFSQERPPEFREVAARVQALTDDGKAAVPASWYVECRELHAESLLPYGSSGEARRFDRYLSRLAGIPTVVGLWDLGDTPDPGYGRTYAGVGRLRRLTPDDPPYYQAGTHLMPAEWWQPNKFEPVWTNNEYDLILALGREVLRGNRSPELRQRLRWFARHAIEVDFVRYSDDPNLHHGSPAHSAEHNRASSYPSHLWCEGLLVYYCLSGDDDALETAIAVGDSILRTFADPERHEKLWSFSRELGWALLYLASLADLTGERRFLDCARAVAETLVREPLDAAQIRSMAVYAFGASSIAMGVEALWRVTGEPELAAWLDRIARAITAHVDGEARAESAMVLNFFNAALACSPADQQLFRTGAQVVEALADSKTWYDPQLFAKPVAMLYRGLSRFAKHALEAGCFTADTMRNRVEQ